jgi:5S rRNA maturation endonuclease (ribonuclease M5)
MWQISTASKENVEKGFRKTSAVFAIFGEELIGRLESQNILKLLKQQNVIVFFDTD